MRILMLAQFYPPIIGGEERHVRNLSIALARRGHDVTVATLAGRDSPEFQVEDGVKVYRIKGTMQRATFLFSESDRTHAPPFPDPERVVALRRVIAKERPDIVHAHNWLLHSFLPLKTKGGPRFVVTLHDYSHVCARKNFMRDGVQCTGPGLSKCLSCTRGQYGMAKSVVTTLSNFASSALERSCVDKFLTVSGAVAEGNELARFGVPFEVVHNFVPDDLGTLSPDIDPRVEQLPKDGFLLFVGELQRLKGVDKLIEAHSSLGTTVPLVLIGRPNPDTPIDLPPNVKIYHNWPHTAIMQAWSRCLFGITPSVWPDPCPTVVMEAMSVGKPVITTRTGGMPDLVDHEVSGLLVEPGNVADLAAAMKRLLDDKVLRDRLSAGALVKVDTLKAKAIVPRIEKVYLDLLSEHSSRGGRPVGSADAQAGTAPSSRSDLAAKGTVPAPATAVLASAAAAPAEDDSASVVICVHDSRRRADICQAIESVLAQTPRVPEVVVVADRNDALGADIAATFGRRVRVTPNIMAPGLSGARNTGIRSATTRYVAFLDDDAVAEPGWLAAMIAQLKKPGVVGAGPHIAPIWLGARPGWFPSEFLWVVGCSFRPGEIAATPVRNLSGAAMCFRRDIFTHIGGFTSVLGRTGGKLPLSCEETELCIRARRELGPVMGQVGFICDPTASIGHKVPAARLNLSYFALRCYAEGISKAQVAHLSGPLDTERGYVVATLWPAATAALASSVRERNLTGISKAGAIALGLACASAGYLRGKWSVAAMPLAQRDRTALIADFRAAAAADSSERAG